MTWKPRSQPPNRLNARRAKEARKRLHEERRQHQRTEVETKVAGLKAKLPARHRDEPSADEDQANAHVASPA